MLLHHGSHTLNTFTILDDGSEKAMLLSAGAWEISLQGMRENRFSSVSIHISPHLMNQRPTLPESLAELLPMDYLQKKYTHLVGLPIKAFEKRQTPGSHWL